MAVPVASTEGARAGTSAAVLGVSRGRNALPSRPQGSTLRNQRQETSYPHPRIRYGLSRTGMGYRATHPLSRSYHATRSLCHVRSRALSSYAIPSTDVVCAPIRSSYAVPGTEIVRAMRCPHTVRSAYACATRCPVLIQHMVVPVHRQQLRVQYELQAVSPDQVHFTYTLYQIKCISLRERAHAEGCGDEDVVGGERRERGERGERGERERRKRRERRERERGESREREQSETLGVGGGGGQRKKRSGGL
eukprot:3668244-Rhodomonas_salina.1